MTSELKCPFCQQELHKDPDGYYSCYTDNCSVMSAGGNGASGTESLWQALTQAKQDLEQYKHKDNLQQQLNANNNQIQENYKQIVEIDGRIIESLEKDLEIARKALEKLNCEYDNCRVEEFEGADIDWEWWAMAAKNVVENALEQIEHKEGK